MTTNELSTAKNNHLILVSNSQLDGFKEGDGDLMDQLVSEFNKVGYKSIRIIENSANVPDDKKDLFMQKKLIALGDQSKQPIKELQEKLILFIEENIDEEQVVTLYIGSRINVREEEEKITLFESGSLYTRDFIKKLKELGVVIVVNCLEYKFFKRSPKELPRLRELLRQQLAFADGIHFLNEHDLSNFQKTIESLIDSQKIYIHKKLSRLNEETGYYYRFEDEEIKSLEVIQSNSKFISGIYTVDPLSDQKIVGNAEETNEDNIVSALTNRVKNILQFGLIRGEKGILESIQLAQELQGKESISKVIVVGKIMGSFMMFRQIIQNIFYNSKEGLTSNLKKDLLNICKTIDSRINLGNKKVDAAKLKEKFFEDCNEKFNEFCQKVYNKFSEQYPLAVKNLEIYFNLKIEDIHNIVMRCRYALKLDHKGMANNASTIVSCFGFYLPTFTSIGMLTGNDFKTKHANQEEKTWSEKYKHSIIASVKQYDSNQLNASHPEVIPSKMSIDEIVDIIHNETDETYRDRITTLRQMKRDEIFEIKNVASKIVETVFSPLWQSRIEETNSASHFKR